LKKMHKAEIAELVRESNRKFNELLAERLAAEDALRQKAEDELAKARAEAAKALEKKVKNI
jgi:hypothetical protein